MSAQEPPRSEEELQAEIDEQVRRLRVQDLLMEMSVSVLNLAARRIAKEDERDLEQARVGIEAVRALVDLLDPEPAKQVREAVSQVQMLYAQQVGGQGGTPEDEEPGPESSSEGGDAPQAPPGTGGRPSGLWTPPGSS